MNSKIKKLIFIIPFFSLLSVFLIKCFLNNQYGDYYLLDRCKDYNFKVLNIKQYKGIIYINDSLELATSYRNVIPLVMLDEFIKKGDSIVLKTKNDTIYLYRNKKKHWFIYYGNQCGYNEPSWFVELFN